MTFVEDLLKKAKAANKTIVLCEGEDKRVVEAASKITKEGIAKIILIGSDEDIKASGSNADLTGVTIVDPAKDANADKYAELLFKAREGKINKKTGAPEYADVAAAKAAILKDHTMYGALILKAGDAASPQGMKVIFFLRHFQWLYHIRAQADEIQNDRTCHRSRAL